MRRVIDLSSIIQTNMPNYSILPRVKIEKIRTIEKVGDNVTTIFTPSHAGTHVDAPIHQIKGGISLDKIPPERFIGEALIIDVSYKYDSYNKLIFLSDLKGYLDKVKEGDIVVLNSGCYNHPEQFEKFGHIDIDVAEWLVKKRISLFAVDTPSVDLDVTPGEKMPIHQILLGAGIPIIEGLVNLDQITKERFIFIGLPLKIKDGDGGSCRAVAIEDNAVL